MKRLLLTPCDWPCSLAECPPGPFVYEDILCFKSEYRTPDGATYTNRDSHVYVTFPYTPTTEYVARPSDVVAPDAPQTATTSVPQAACQCEECRRDGAHASDCAVHNAPALPAEPCDCGKTSIEREG